MVSLVQKDEYDQFNLVISKKEALTHDSFIMDLKFPNRDWTSGFPVGCSFNFFATIKGQTISRRYTTISPLTQRGYVSFAIKVYNKSKEFPNGGLMSQWLDSRKVGDTIAVEGYFGKLKYLGWGQFLKRKEMLPVKRHVGLIAAGSGITKMLTIIQASVLANDGL